MKKDWTGNKNSIWCCIGASNHSKAERDADDYYATDPRAAELLLEVEPELNNIWECACGEGHLARVFENAGKLNWATDLVNRGYGNGCYNFLSSINFLPYEDGDIVTNPPYKYAKEFVQKALALIDEGRKVCMFLKLTFLEGKERRNFFEKYPPKTIYVCSSRINCAKGGDFSGVSGAVAYAWFVWVKGFDGIPIIKWIN